MKMEQEKESERKRAIQKMQKELEFKIEQLQQHQIELNEKVKNVKEKNHKDMILRIEENRLKQMEKWENVERLRKMEEYRKEKEKERIQLENERSKRIKEKKNKILKQRGYARGYFSFSLLYPLIRLVNIYIYI